MTFCTRFVRYIYVLMVIPSHQVDGVVPQLHVSILHSFGHSLPSSFQCSRMCVHKLDESRSFVQLNLFFKLFIGSRKKKTPQL